MMITIILVVHLLLLLLSSCGYGVGAIGDPAPGRSPGPPSAIDNNAVSGNSSGNNREQCHLEGDVIVIDKEKAALLVNFTHPLFETNVLTHGVIYQVSISKKHDDNNLIQGFSLHSLGDGVPKGHFWSNEYPNNKGCSNNNQDIKKSTVQGRLEDTNNVMQALHYNWTLTKEEITRSNVTFRLRYKIYTSGSVFQVNYQFAISQGCQLWLKMSEANISSSEIPHQSSCQIHFPNHRRLEHGLVSELTRLNVPCAGGAYIQFLGIINPNADHFRSYKQFPRLCGKLEELTEPERRFYFPNLKNQSPYLYLHGNPIFNLNYRLVDYCYNVTFTSRNGSFELEPNTDELQCTFKIFLPFGFKISLRLEIGTPTSSQIETLSSSEVVKSSHGCRGLFVEVHDGPVIWQRCFSETGKIVEIESNENRLVMKMHAYSREYNSGLNFRYQAKPIPDIVQQCSFGWVAVRQFCVTAIETNRLTWMDAELECNSKGGHLASIRSEQAQRVIDNLLINSPGYHNQNAYWLGASDKVFEGDFRWTDGLPFSYTNWFPGWPEHNHYNRQPNDDGMSDQDCIELRRVYNIPTTSTQRLADTFMWNDRDCSTPNYFLCERLVVDEPIEDGWAPECNRTVILTPEQSRASVSSPSFPRQYPDNVQCETDITAPPGFRIIMDFEELVLEKEPHCSYDYLDVIEVSNHNQSVARRLCDDWSAKLKLLRYVSKGSRIKLRFVSDYSHHYGGFKARVSMENAMQCADDRLTMFNNSCYLFVSYPEVSWSTAQQICKGMRAQLSSIQSPDEERFITTNIRRQTEYRTSAVYWLGARMKPGGRFQWIDDTPMIYNAWLPGQNPEEQEIGKKEEEMQCLGIQWTSSPTPMLPSGLYWRSKKCTLIGGYICKRHNQISGSQLNFNQTINGTGGQITSPNYPGNYYNNLDFLIKLIGPERSRLIVEFSRLDLEPQLECLYDYIQLRSRFSRGVKSCGTHDTDMSRFNFVSDSNEVELKFHSDYSITGNGFSARWRAVDVSGCPLQTLTAREGVAASPNYPNFLLARLDCTVTILAPIGKRVWLQFTDFDLNGRNEYEAVLELHLGGSSSAFQPFQHKGHISDGVYVSMNERLQIKLKTADHPSGKGFRAIYKTLSTIQEERIIDLSNTTTGTLMNLNYPNRAPANINFLEHLIAPLGYIILLELHHVKFSEIDCPGSEGSIEVFDNYADSNGTFWRLCYDHEEHFQSAAPLAITSYLNTLHLKQKSGSGGIPLNGTLRVQTDLNYKIKLLRQEENLVESCNPNPCQNDGKCISNGGKKVCQCLGHYTGLFCALTLCELEPCVFGQCTLTGTSFRCHCQQGYTGATCELKQKPCEGNPCEGRGECIERGETFHCRCHAWWEGPKCERRMLHIPFRPLSERMLHEPFWLGLITVTVVLGIIGLVWCARRHFPEKLEKLLAEESDRNKYPYSLRSSSLRNQLSGIGPSSAAALVVPTTPAGGCQRSLFGRLGIRKPSILSLTSPHGHLGVGPHATATAATARTFSLDDLLKPPPRRTPSPRKKRNNSTPTKKNAAEKKQILQQLITPNHQQRSQKVNIGELIQLSERKLKEQSLNDSYEDLKETHLSETNILSDPKLEKKVTFARLLNKVSAEMSSGSEIEMRLMQANKLMCPRPASTPPSPGVEIRSPNSTCSNQGSDSLSSSDLGLTASSMLCGRRNGRFQTGRQKPVSADSILAMFRNFSSTSAAANLYSSVKVSPSTTPTASTPQDDLVGDDDSTTSPISFSSPLDSPPSYRKQHSSIEVPVLDALNAYSGTNFLQPPTILLEVPNVISKCLSPIREMPTPMPTPLPSPCMTPMHRSTASSSADDLALDFSDDHISVELPFTSINYSDDEEVHRVQDIVIDDQAEDGLMELKTPEIIEPKPEVQTSFVIPTLTIQQPSPTHNRPPTLIVPGSPPPQRDVNNFQFGEKQSRGRLLKDLDKPNSLDLPSAPPLITITCNLSEAESDGDTLSPAVKSSTHLGVVASGNAGMCYLSPFSMCSRADRTTSESNLSSSGYSSMASPGPSRCGSSNPLCPSEMEDPGPSGPNLPRRPSPLLKTSNLTEDNQVANATERCRGRSDSETLSDDPLIESNDEGIGTDHIDEKIEDGELKSAKELEVFIEKDLPKLPSMDRLVPPVVVVSAKMSLQLPSIVVQTELPTHQTVSAVSPVSSRSESPLSDRTQRFSTQFCGAKSKDSLPFTDSDGLYDFPSSDCAPLNKLGAQHRKATGRKREKKSTRTALKSPTKTTASGLHHFHLDVPGKEHHRVQTPRKPSPKRRSRNQQQQLVTSSSSSSTESLDSAKELKYSSQSSPSPETIRLTSSPTNWLDWNTTRRRAQESSEEDNAEESSSVVDDLMIQNKKISRLRTIGHQIRFLRRLEKNLLKKDHRSACLSDSVDSGDAEVTSPLLQPQTGSKVEIRKSNSIGKLPSATKRKTTKKNSDLLIPQEEVTWPSHMLITGNGYSD